MTRRAWVLAFPLLLRADERDDITQWLGSVVNQLSQENAPGFLRAFSPDLRDKLEQNVWAMVRTAELSSSVDILEIKAGGSNRDLLVDWYLDIKPHASSNPSEQRRQQVKLRLERAKKGWTIVMLSPLDFLRP